MYRQSFNKRYPRGGFEKPVKEGEQYEVEIEAIAEKGDGIAKVKGFVVFVPNTQKGQKVKIKIDKVLNRFAFGEVVDENNETDEQDTEEEVE